MITEGGTNLPRPILVGVSGGADSVYLLHLLSHGEKEGLIICHLNHGLRGDESDLDAAFVSQLCQHYGLPYEQKKIDLASLMEERAETSMETRAREERLKFFQAVGEKYGTSHLALAHHADDQAETLLMNLCRGSAGLKGMESPAELKEYALTVWRPLLHLRKKEILAHLQEQQLEWREDYTNQESVVTRNKVRNDVIPLLNEVFKREVTPNINRGYQSSIRPLLPEILLELKVYDPQGRLYLPRVLELSTELRKLVLHTYLIENGIADLSQSKITECLSLLTEEQSWKINLPGGQFLRRKEKRIFLEET